MKVADEDKEKWDALEKAGEVIGRGCLLGGMCGNLISTEEIKQNEPEKWVSKTSKEGKVNSIS